MRLYIEFASIALAQFEGTQNVVDINLDVSTHPSVTGTEQVSTCWHRTFVRSLWTQIRNI